MQILIGFIIVGLVGYLLWRLTLTPKSNSTVPTTSSRPKAPKPNLYPPTTVVSPDKFQTYFKSRQACVDPGTLVISAFKNHRVNGAMIDLTPRILKMRMQAIANGQVQRDDNARKQALVPGYDSVKHEWFGDQPLWHRTHLIPFRMVLSEGDDHPGLLMAATAYLNMGQRPQTGYYEDDYEQKYRENRLYQWYAKKWFLSLTSPKQIVANKKYRANYSLDDIERLVTHIILSHQKDNSSFRYQVQPLYQATSTSQLANAVWVQLIDQTHHRVLVNVILPNIR